MKGKQLKIGAKRVWMHKAIKNSNFSEDSVLSNNPWSFVELWLKRLNNPNALSYWIQARNFYDASVDISVDASPLLLYYSFLNATKALLEVHSQVNRKIYHGVSGDRPENAKTSLANEKVKFQTGGVLPLLCSYLGESVGNDEYDLKSLLWNIPYVHRAFHHTYKSEPELFIPLEKACYVSRDDISKGWFEAEVVPRYSDRRILNRIPGSFECFDVDGKTYVRRKKRFRWYKGRVNKAEKQEALARLSNYHGTTRRVIVPISGNRDLWYLKRSVRHNTLAERHSLTIVFAAMHRLSELSRYDPHGFDKHLCGRANWLITEFIEHAPNQFIDQIASEITGFQFWKPAIRS